MMNTSQRAKGFTLIELIMVMVMLGILTAVAATRWNSTDATAPSQADLLARNIRHMQILAMSWGQPLQLSVTSSTTYAVSCVTSSATSPCNASPVIDPASGLAFSVALVNDVTLAGAAATIDSLGRPVPVTAGTTYTLNAGASTWTVSVAPLTGFTTVSSP